MFEADIAEDLPTIYCDAEKASRVIVNLVAHAIRSATEQGQVRLWARRAVATCEVVVGVTDNGTAIPAEDLERILTRFSQLNKKSRTNGKSLGLGLSIANELTTLNLGTMSAESKPGIGNTFQFTIPCAVPCEVVSRYLDRMSATFGDKVPVSILTATIPDGIIESLALDVDHFLNYLRRHDLLFRIDTSRWLLVLGTPSIELDKFIRRVRRLAEANQNRPRAPLSEVTFQADGTWSPDEGRQEILACVDRMSCREVVRRPRWDALQMRHAPHQN